MVGLADNAIRFFASLAVSDYERIGKRTVPAVESQIQALMDSHRKASLGSYVQALRTILRNRASGLLAQVGRHRTGELPRARVFGHLHKCLCRAAEAQVHDLMAYIRQQQVGSLPDCGWLELCEVLVDYRNRSTGHPDAYEWPELDRTYCSLVNPHLEGALVDLLTSSDLPIVVPDHPLATLVAVSVTGPRAFVHRFELDAEVPDEMEIELSESLLSTSRPGDHFILQRDPDGLSVYAALWDYLEPASAQIGSLSLAGRLHDQADTLASGSAYADEVASGSRPLATGPALVGLAELVEQQTALLRQFGHEVLAFFRRQSDPARPLAPADLARQLRASGGPAVQGITVPQLLGLVQDADTRGFVPGLVRNAAGYYIAEDHIAFKLTQDVAEKRAIALECCRMIHSGMRVALDGGSTTLPIAEALVAALDEERLTDIVILTNSLPIMERIAAFVEGRGWTDDRAPVRVVTCAGIVRPNTKAIAQFNPSGTATLDSLDALFREIGQVDIAFVGANGFTLAEGITMPTNNELPIKLKMLDSAAMPCISADASKFGVRHPYQIADWYRPLTVVTNQPRQPNEELDAILAMQRNVEIRVVEVALQ